MAVVVQKISKRYIAVLMLLALSFLFACYYLVSCGVTAIEEDVVFNVTKHGDGWKIESEEIVENPFWQNIMYVFIAMSMAAFIVVCLYLCIYMTKKKNVEVDPETDVVKLARVNSKQKKKDKAIVTKDDPFIAKGARPKVWLSTSKDKSKTKPNTICNLNVNLKRTCSQDGDIVGLHVSKKPNLSSVAEERDDRSALGSNVYVRYLSSKNSKIGSPKDIFGSLVHNSNNALNKQQEGQKSWYVPPLSGSPQPMMDNIEVKLKFTGTTVSSVSTNTSTPEQTEEHQLQAIGNGVSVADTQMLEEFQVPVSPVLLRQANDVSFQRWSRDDAIITDAGCEYPKTTHSVGVQTDVFYDTVDPDWRMADPETPTEISNQEPSEEDGRKADPLSHSGLCKENSEML